MIKEMFGGVIPALERAIEIRSLRHDVILSNIANEETPGFRARDIDFRREMEKAASGAIEPSATNPGHLKTSYPSGMNAEVVERKPGGAALDGNSVSLEKEMVSLSENTVMHNAAVTILTREFRDLRDAIREGR
ncbi:MAG: flagellar basal body rod protein FlgB [Deltaproteobacteria bacterium]|nr:flagellar basal body rod protein FlgB [Deltaproteobacteria bacterium]